MFVHAFMPLLAWCCIRAFGEMLTETFSVLTRLLYTLPLCPPMTANSMILLAGVHRPAEHTSTDDTLQCKEQF